MARIPLINRDDLSSEHQAIADRMASGRGGSGTLGGVFRALLNSPQAADRVSEVGIFVRFHSSIPDALRELLIITTAREIGCQYEFAAHARIAKDVGVSENVIEAVRNGSAPTGLEGDDAIAVTYAQELLRNHRISDDTFAAMKSRFNNETLTDITVCIGYYTMLGFFLVSMEVDLESTMTPLLPQ